MAKQGYQQGSVVIMVVCLVLIILAIVAYGASAAYVGDRMGAMSGGGMITQPGGATPVVNGACSQSILSQAQIYDGVTYSESNANGTHCGYPSPQGIAGVTHLDCSGLVSRVYRELGLITPTSACLTTVSLASTSQLQQISASQIQPGDIVDIPGTHTVFYVGGDINGVFSTFSCKHTGVPCGPGSWSHVAGQEYFHPTACSSSNSSKNSGS